MAYPYPSSYGNPGVPIKPDLLLVVFIHGFKGSDDAFGEFPGRLQEILGGSIDYAVTECIVYPKYKTQGELGAAVEDFCNWLRYEVSIRVGHDTGKAKVVLCGHSMGGLVAADALIRLTLERPYAHLPPFPRIIACLSFDTPYLGLNPGALSSGAGKAIRIVKKAKANGKLALFAMVVAGAGAAACSGGIGVKILVGGALALFSNWIESHLYFIKHLWKEEELVERINTIIDYDQRGMVLFRTFFTLMPPHAECWTFINVPSGTGYFLEAPNHLAKDIIHAHRDMFEPNLNGEYYRLESETAWYIREAVMLERRVGW